MTLERFKHWKNLVENKTSKKIKVLIIDNRMEFCSIKFEKICKDFGTQRHKTMACTPQQNWLIDRMNRTILEKVK